MEFSSLAAFFTALLCSSLVFSLQSVDLEHPVITVKPQHLQFYTPKGAKDASSCERIHVSSLSRIKLKSYASSIRLTVALSVVIPQKLHNRIQICLHRNASSALCQCENGEWKLVQAGIWGCITSPYEGKYIDVKFVGDISEPITVLMEEEFDSWRLICLAFGVVLLLSAPILSTCVPFYYISFMVLGIMLVIGFSLFKLMKLLPASQKNVVCLAISVPLVGAVSFVVRQFSLVVKYCLMNFRLNEHMHNPVFIFPLVFMLLAGAAVGFWIVRNFVTHEDGSVKVGIAQFVKWAMQIIASTFILQGSSDTFFKWSTLGFSWVICSFVTHMKWRLGPSWVICTFITHLKWRKSRCRAENQLHSPLKGEIVPVLVTVIASLELLYLAPLWNGLTSPIRRVNSEKDYYSTLHGMPKQTMSKKEWKKWTRESTQQAMAELTSSPEFIQWLIMHANQIHFHSDDSSDESVTSA